MRVGGTSGKGCQGKTFLGSPWRVKSLDFSSQTNLQLSQVQCSLATDGAMRKARS